MSISTAPCIHRGMGTEYREKGRSFSLSFNHAMNLSQAPLRPYIWSELAPAQCVFAAVLVLGPGVGGNRFPPAVHLGFRRDNFKVIGSGASTDQAL